MKVIILAALSLSITLGIASYLADLIKEKEHGVKRIR